MEKKRNSNIKNIKQIIAMMVFFVVIIISVCFSNLNYNENNVITSNITKNETYTYCDIDNIPDYTDNICITINNNVPYFSESDYTTEPFEIYSDLDEYGRCGVAFANICKEIMPSKAKGDERESLKDVIPTGWKQTIYDGIELYHRCHLIGFQLAGENANKLNLITGTRYFNVQGMEPFENQVAEYITKNEDNHVLYRVTPVFKDDNLIASGVEMEAYSVEDNGKGLHFNVFIYNIQPGIEIDYLNGSIKK